MIYISNDVYEGGVKVNPPGDSRARSMLLMQAKRLPMLLQMTFTFRFV